MRREVECASENSDVTNNTPKAARKRKASEKEPSAILGTVDMNTPNEEVD